MRENKTDKLPQHWFRSNNVQLWRVFTVQASEGRMNGFQPQNGNDAFVQPRHLHLNKVKKHKNVFTNARMIEATQMTAENEGCQNEGVNPDCLICLVDIML